MASLDTLHSTTNVADSVHVVMIWYKYIYFLLFQAMKGEKGIPGVSVGDTLGEELTDDSFSKLFGFLLSVQFAQASQTAVTQACSLV